jgi:plastocyanin
MASRAVACHAEIMRALLALSLCATLGLAACGGSNDNSGGGSSSKKSSSSSNSGSAGSYGSGTPSSTSGKGSTIRLSADPSKLAFNKTSLQAKAGTVTLVMSNPSGIPHAIGVQGKGLDKDGKTVQKGGTSKVTAKLKPGTYTFYCPVDGHRAAGMKGTLVVK